MDTTKLLETLKTDQSKSGIFLNEVAQKYPLGVMELLERLGEAGITTIGLALSNRNLSNEVFQKFLYDSWVLRMKTLEEGLTFVKNQSTEDLKKSIITACIFFNAKAATAATQEQASSHEDRDPDGSAALEEESVVESDEVSDEKPPSRIQLEDDRFEKLPEKIKQTVASFRFTSEHEVLAKIGKR